MSEAADSMSLEKVRGDKPAKEIISGLRFYFSDPHRE
jgi:hypothetical protein